MFGYRTMVVGAVLGATLGLLSMPAADATPAQSFTIEAVHGPALPPAGGPTRVTPNSCSPDPIYTTWSGTSTWIGDANRINRGRGPETITLQTTGTDTVGATFGDTTGVSVSGIIASAHTDISGAIQLSTASGVVMGSSYAVPSGHLGWLEWGNWGWHYYWSYGHYAGCTWVTKSGASNSPQYTGKGFNHGYT